MADRSWFYAANGQQQGPYPETQFRDLIGRGSVNAQTLVWSEGMASWQKAGDVPGLIGGGMAPPAMPPGGGAVTGAGNYATSPASYDGSGALSLDFGIWDFTWRTVLMVVGSFFIIPVPWLIVWYLKWLVPCVKVPGRSDLSFEGTAGTVAKWYFGVIALIIVLAVISAVSGSQSFGTVGNFVQIALYWLLLKYLVASLATNQRLLGLSFTGSFWAFLGWNLLLVLSVITVVGWAWVLVAQIRWIVRNIEGTRREVVFKGTGFEMLWRGIVSAIACAFIIPIPWVYRWMLGWQLSQTVLIDHGATAREARVFE